MRIGVMIGPERGRFATKVERMATDAEWAEAAGLASIWTPQIPDEFDALTAATVMGTRTSRIEIGTAVVPIQTRHPIALLQQALSTQAVLGGRLALGIGVSHHWIVDEMLGLPYERPLAEMRATIDVLDQGLAGPGPVDVDNGVFRIHNPLSVTDLAPPPVLLAALGPKMLQLAGERADGTILWLADERAIATHVAPILTRAAAAADRPAPRIVAGVPVCLCGDDEVDVAVAARQPRAVRSRGVAELPEAARPRRRAERRRHLGGRQRVEPREAAAVLRRRRRHRPVRAGRPDRRGPGAAPGVDASHPRVPGGPERLALTRRPPMAAPTLDIPVFDADNHLYETRDSLTKHLPSRYKRAVDYVEVRGRTKIVVRGQISDYIPNPTFDVVAKPGAMEEYFRKGNPDGKSRREIFGEPMRSIPAFREPAPRVELMDEQGIDRTLMFPTLASLIEERMRDDPDMCHAVIHSLNEWIYETWTFNHDDRIFTTPVITLPVVDKALEELEWCVARGAKAVLIRPAPAWGYRGPRSPGLPEFDALWEKVVEHDLLVAMHSSDSGYERHTNEWMGNDSEYLPFEPKRVPHAVDLATG